MAIKINHQQATYKGKFVNGKLVFNQVWHH